MNFTHLLKTPVRERIIRNLLKKRERTPHSGKIDISSIKDILVLTEYAAADEKILEKCHQKLKTQFKHNIHFVLFSEQAVDVLKDFHTISGKDFSTSLSLKNTEVQKVIHQDYSLCLVYNPGLKQEIQYLAASLHSKLIIGSEKFRTDLYDIILYDADSSNLLSFADHSIELLQNISSS